MAAGRTPPDPLAGLGRPGPAPEGDLAGRDQGEDVRPLRLGAGVAGAWVEAWGARRGRSGLAAGRGAGRWHDQVRPVQPARRHEPPACGPPLEEPLAGRARVSADEGRVGPGPLPDALPAPVPPPTPPRSP